MFSKKDLEWACRSNSVWARVDAAEHPALSEDQIRILAKDTHYVVRRRIAEHLKTPSDVLTELCLTTPMSVVLMSLIRHPNLSEEGLMLIAGQQDFPFNGPSLHALLNHPKAPTDIWVVSRSSVKMRIPV